MKEGFVTLTAAVASIDFILNWKEFPFVGDASNVQDAFLIQPHVTTWTNWVYKMMGNLVTESQSWKESWN